MESLNTSDSGRCVLSLDTYKVDILIDLGGSLLDCSSHNAASSGYVNGLIDGHKEFLLYLTSRNLEPFVHRFRQFLNRLSTQLSILAVQGAEGGSLDEGRVISVILVL